MIMGLLSQTKLVYVAKLTSRKVGINKSQHLVNAYHVPHCSLFFIVLCMCKLIEFAQLYGVLSASALQKKP